MNAFTLSIFLFFASGLSSLVYQIVWTRLLVLVFGSTTLATSTVLSVFMGGLALGSFLAGRISDKVKEPFLWYGVLEGVIGLWALVVPFLFIAAVPFYTFVWQNFHMSLIPFSLLRFVLVALVLIVPTTCMGATLPLLARFVATSLDTVGSRVGALYSVNTCGAVVGAALAGFALLPMIGIQTTIYISAAINFVLLACVLVGSTKLEKPPDPVPGGLLTNRKASEARERAALSKRAWIIMAAFAVSGAVAMIYEVAWTRSLLFVIGSSTYSFTVMLCTFLIGIFLGSIICARFIDRSKDAVALFAILQCYLCLAGYIAMLLFNFVPWWNLEAIAAHPHEPGWIFANKLWLSASIMLPLALGLGAIFPAVVKACTQDLALVGRSVGTVYSANTLGAIVGAFLAGFVMIPALGVERTLIFCAAINLLLGAGLACLSVSLTKFMKVALAITAAVAAVACAFVPQIWDRHVISSAQIARRSLVTRPLPYKSFDAWVDSLRQTRDLLYWKDGPASTVGILRMQPDSAVSLVTNGHVDASDGEDMRTQVMLSVLPLLLHPSARDVGIVGWGSGVTVGAASLFPVTSIVTVELEPSVIEASKFFHHVNKRVETDPRVHIEINDGRNYLLATDKQFDILISEPSNPWQAGVCNLFTREYFSICKSRMKSDGLFACWLQSNEVPPDDLRAVVASLRAVFPHCVAFGLAPGDLVFVAGTKPITLDVPYLQSKFSDKVLAKEMTEVGLNSVDDILDRIELTSDGARQLAKTGKQNVDDTNKLEYDVASAYEVGLSKTENRDMIEKYFANPWEQINFGKMSPKDQAAMFARVAKSALSLGHARQALWWAYTSNALVPSSEAFRLAGLCNSELEQKQKAEKLWEKGLLLKPDNMDLLETRGMSRLEDGRVLEARADFQRVLKIDPNSKIARYHLALSYMPPDISQVRVSTERRLTNEGDANKVLKWLGDLPLDTEFLKKHHEVLYMAGWANYQLGNRSEAEPILRRYVVLEPRSIYGKETLAATLKMPEKSAAPKSAQ